MTTIIAIMPENNGRHVKTLRLDLESSLEAINEFNRLCKYRQAIVSMFKNNKLVKHSSFMVRIKK